jgi:hypothetical protein
MNELTDNDRSCGKIASEISYDTDMTDTFVMVVEESDGDGATTDICSELRFCCCRAVGTK